MNSIFSLNRFGKLFKKHTFETYRLYLMSTLVLCGVLALLYAFFTLTGGALKPAQRYTAMVIIYLLAGTIFTSSIYSGYSQKGQAIVGLTLPASHFEKFIVGWIYSLLIYTAVFAVCFVLIDYVFVMLKNVPENERSIINILPEKKALSIMFYAYAFLHSIVLWGAIYFNGMHFIKTACWFFVALIVLCLIHYSFQKSQIEQEIFFSPPLIGGLKFNTGKGALAYQHIALEQSQKQFYAYFCLSVFTFSFWGATFFRFREKQV